MKELDINYRHENNYRELFSVRINSLTCEDTAIGITNDGELLYVESKLMNNSSAYWVQSVFYSIDREEFNEFLEQARSRGYIEQAIQKGQTTEEELKMLSGVVGDKGI